MKLPVWTENLNNWLKKTCDLDWLEMIYVLLPLLLGVVYCSGLSTDLCKYYQTFVGKILFWAAIVVMVIFLIYSYWGRNGETPAELRAQKDTFMIWGAVGSMFMFVVKENHLFTQASKETIMVFAVASLYIALVIGIFYKHLCRKIYQSDEKELECTINEKKYIIVIKEIKN